MKRSMFRRRGRVSAGSSSYQVLSSDATRRLNIDRLNRTTHPAKVVAKWAALVLTTSALFAALIAGTEWVIFAAIVVWAGTCTLLAADD